jgi:hypothetical protein
MGPSSYMRSVVERNVVMRRMTVIWKSIQTSIIQNLECAERVHSSVL